mgnify:CR=1 FL=1
MDPNAPKRKYEDDMVTFQHVGLNKTRNVVRFRYVTRLRNALFYIKKRILKFWILFEMERQKAGRWFKRRIYGRGTR